MPITEHISPALAHWPDAAEMKRRAGPDGLLVLPDRVSPVDGGTIAAFREDAQALRVRGQGLGLRVELVAPDGAQLGVYREHAVDWVLPVVVFLGVQTAGIVSSLIANEIQRRIDAWREAGAGRVPTLRYREVRFEQDRAELREIEGPAEDVIAWLRERPAERPVGEIEGSSE